MRRGRSACSILGISPQQLFQQLLVGLINGSFYALLSLGLAVIFGMLNIVNFAHGALYMMGAFAGSFLLQRFRASNYWFALVLVADRSSARSARCSSELLLRRLDRARSALQPAADLRPGAGHPRPVPEFLRRVRACPTPSRRRWRAAAISASCSCRSIAAWVIVFSVVVCFSTWFLIEKTRLGAYLRAATENPTLVRAFGINVPRMITLTYAFGIGLAALAGVLAAPIYQVRPAMGADIISVVFAVVVIGGMGSILGSIVTGFALGVIEGLTKVFYPEASNTVVFVIMAIVLLVTAGRPVREGRLMAEHAPAAPMRSLAPGRRDEEVASSS